MKLKNQWNRNFGLRIIQKQLHSFREIGSLENLTNLMIGTNLVAYQNIFRILEGKCGVFDSIGVIDHLRKLNKT